MVSEKESEGGINDTDIRMDHICRVALRSVGDPQKRAAVMAFYMGKLWAFCTDDDLPSSVLYTAAGTVVAALAGGFGKLTGMFQSYFKYGVIFVNSRAGLFRC